MDINLFRSSPASPGQSYRRDELLRLYGEMTDSAKQELLLFAEDLHREAAEDLHREASPGCPERE
jgi:hypothetical protein